MLASPDARWVTPTPEQLHRRAMRSFRLRWPLLLAELAELPLRSCARPVVIEGFGLLPDLVRPLMDNPAPGALVTALPRRFAETRGCAAASPAFRHEVSDPDRAADNLWTRDLELADTIERQARAGSS